MSDKRIIDLEAKQTLGSGDYLAADSAQGTYKVDANTNIMTPLANVRNNVANSSASPDKYSSSTAYKVGDMVIQNDILYKCTTACSAASWAVNSACFRATTLASVVTQLNSDLNLVNAHKLRPISTPDFTKLSAAVSEQNLEKYGFRIGDYWTQGTYKYVLADLNSFKGSADYYGVIGSNHITILVITDATSKWATSNDTSGGYKGSILHSYLKTTVLPTVKSHLGSSHIKSHRLLWSTNSNDWDWSDDNEEISALTESQVNGAPILSINGLQQGESDRQLEVFRKFKYTEVWGNITVWGRCIYSAARACSWGDGGGYAGSSGASGAARVVGLIIWA